MGERLNLEIERHGTTLANCYYHWSGFTGSAAELAIEAIKAEPKDWGYNGSPLQAIEMLSATGAALDEASRAAINKLYGDEIKLPSVKAAMERTLNRNNGLISVTSFGMYETRMWEEERVVIDTTNRVVRFGALLLMDEYEYDEEEINDAKSTAKEIGHGINSMDIPFDKMSEFIEALNAVVEHDNGVFLCNGKLYSMIY